MPNDSQILFVFSIADHVTGLLLIEKFFTDFNYLQIMVIGQYLSYVKNILQNFMPFRFDIQNKCGSRLLFCSIAFTVYSFLAHVFLYYDSFKITFIFPLNC